MVSNCRGIAEWGYHAEDALPDSKDVCIRCHASKVLLFPKIKPVDVDRLRPVMQDSFRLPLARTPELKVRPPTTLLAH